MAMVASHFCVLRSVRISGYSWNQVEAVEVTQILISLLGGAEVFKIFGLFTGSRGSRR